ncbi:MAG: TetR family transcriptional regulator [Rhodocyclaceae bacterium]|nr:TetR family transcriptional regulator [Rhodocyclaceae bacterium]
MKKPKSSEQDGPVEATRERILNVAARLFTERGFAGTSMRQIAGEASVPLSSINYHFGSKQALMESVYGRMLDSVGRRDYLDKLQAEAGERPLTVAEIVRAYMGSALRLTKKDSMSGALFRQLMARAFFEPGDPAESFFPAQFEKDTDRYKEALMRALPHLDEAEVVWRMYWFVGLMAYVLGGKDIMRMKARYGLPDADDPERILERMVPFVVSAMEAPRNPA